MHFLVQGVQIGERPSRDIVLAERGLVPHELLHSNLSSVIHEMQHMLRDEDGFEPFRIEIVVTP